MSTKNIQFHDKLRIFYLNIRFLDLSEEFHRTQKRIRMIHGKRAIGVRAIEVLLYVVPQSYYNQSNFV